MDVEKLERLRELAAAGVCPGCGAPLRDVAGLGAGHYRGGDVRRVGSGWTTTEAGEVMGTFGTMRPDDVRVCVYSPDDLVTLVLVGAGVVGEDGPGLPLGMRPTKNPGPHPPMVSP